VRLRIRLRTVEAMCALTVALMIVRSLPFRSIVRLTGRAEAGSPDHHVNHRPEDLHTRDVGSALRSGAWRLPWHSTCLVRAVAGRLMLLRRGISSALILGVATSNGQTRAHAWLLAGGGTVCGGEDAPEFSPIVAFRSEAAR
jgi:hypothetical protein